MGKRGLEGCFTKGCNEGSDIYVPVEVSEKKAGKKALIIVESVRSATRVAAKTPFDL